MIDDQPWLVRRRVGNLRKISRKEDRAFLTAIREVAIEETERTGEKVGDAVVIQTLVVGSGPFYTQQRKRIRQRIEQLNKENQHANKGGAAR